MSHSPRARKTRTPKLAVTQLEDRSVPSGVAQQQHDGGPGPNAMPPSFSYSQPSGFLTGPQAGDRDSVARSTLANFAASAGLTPADVAAADITDSYTSQGQSHVYFRQQVNGLPVINTSAGVGLMPDGRAIMVNVSLLPNLAASTPPTAANGMSAVDAVEWAAFHLGYTLQTAPTVLSRPGGVRQTVVVSEPEFSDQDIKVQRGYVNTPRGVRDVWELVARTPDGQHWYDATVDAQDGGVEFWADWMDNLDTYNVLGVPNESPNEGGRSVLVNPADPNASPFGWHDTNGVAGAEFTDTRGNNVSAQDDTDANNTGGARPSGGSNLIFDFPFDQTAAPSGYLPAATTNLFYGNNVMHDVYQRYGFDEASGNFQTKNYTGAGAGNDAVQADAQDGSGTNNANFGTPPDGSAPRMQMYVWTAANPDRDSDLDNGVIFHEYGHGISNRLTGGPANSSALNNLQSGGMGEGWSDFQALMMTQRPTDQPNDKYGIGTYVINQPQTGNGIRQKPYSFDMSINPMTFSDYGTGANQSTEVHWAGALWCSALWDMNWLLINKYGYDQDMTTGYAPGGGPASAGNKLALQLVLNGMKLQAVNPSFTQARDAILAADVALTGGVNQREIWTAFARRGLGAGASTANSSSTSVTTSFAMPAAAAAPGITAQSPNGLTQTAPSSITFTFSEAMNTGSFSVAADVASFTGPGGANLLGAITGFAWTTSTTLRVDFTAQTTSGLYMMVLGPNITDAGGTAMDQDFDGTPGEATQDRYTANFRYDPVTLSVTAITPATGATVSVNTTTIDVTFSEAFLASSLTTADLNLSQGTVTGATQLSPTQARFTVSGFSGSIGEATIYLSLKYGAVTDAAGFPSLAFNSSFSLDYSTVAFTTPLTAAAPLGSLVYDGTFGLATRVSPGTDTDSFTITLDPNQRLSAILTPALGTTLVPVVTILDGGGATVGTATGTAGNPTTATADAAAGGTYTVRVSSSGGTTGAYSLRLLLNAAGEGEGYGGAANNTAATAQNIGPLFTTPAAGVSVASVVGQTDPTGFLPTEVEPNETTATADDAGRNFAAASGSSIYQLGWTGNIATSTNQDWVNIGALQAGDVVTVTMSGQSSGAGTLTDPFLELWRAGSAAAVTTSDDDGPGTDSLIYRFTVATTDTYYVLARPYDANTGTGTYRVGVRLENTGAAPTTGGNFTAEAEANDTLATANDGSTSWRQVQNQAVTTGSITAGDTDVIKYAFTAGDRVTIKAVGAGGLQPNVELLNSSGTLVQLVDNSRSEESTIYGYVVPTTGTYFVRVTSAAGTGTYTLTVFQTGATPATPVAGVDYYAVPLVAGQTVSVGLRRAGGAATVEFLDTNGSTVLATGTAATNYTAGLVATATAAGTYYVRVSDLSVTAYQVTVSLGAILDQEANDAPATAEGLAAGGQVLGGITAGDSDYFSVLVPASGLHLRATTTTPGDAAGEFVNTLDPVVEIYDNGGTLLASDDNSAGDGRNARVTSPTLTAGLYLIRVRAAGTTTGEYSLTTALIPNQSPTGVTAGGPYSIAEGDSLTLSATATDPDGDPLTYSWDINGDGAYPDAVGANPTLTWAQLVALGITDGPYTGTIRVQVLDGYSPLVTSPPVALTVANAPPTATVTNSGPVPEGTTTPVTVDVTNVADPSAQDTAAGIHFAYDFGNDGSFETGDGTYAGSGTATSVTVPAALLADGDASLVVRVRVMDDDGDFNEYLTTVVVTNVAPTAGLTNGGAVDEGSDATVTATGTDVPADQPTLRYAYDFGNDGTYEVGGATYAQAVPDKTATVPTTDSGLMNVRVRVFDKDGAFSDAVTTITVNNVAPTATLGSGGPVVEGSKGKVSFTGVFDPSLADTAAGFTYDFDFNNDGSFDVISATSPDADVPAKYLPDGPATQTVRARVSDKDGGASEYTTTITVTNAPPTATFGNGGTVAENTAGSVRFSNPADPSPIDLASLHYAYDFDNDGTFDLGGDTYGAAVTDASVTVPAKYLADGPFNRVVRARVYDKDGGFTEYTTTIAVTNTNPTGTLSTGGTTPVGTPTTVRFFNVTDAPADLASLRYQFTFTVNGQTTTLTSTTPQVDFTFPDPGTYVVLARVTDKDGGFTNRTATAVVTDVPPAAVLAGSSAPEGGTATVTFTSATHPGAAATAAGIHYAYDFDNDGVFDLGDGTYGGSGTGATATLPANLVQDSGTRTVRARAIEVNGLFTDVLATVTITPAPPTGTLTAPGSVVSGRPFAVTFSNVTDPSPADQAAGFTYSFDTDGDGVFETTSTTPTVTIALPGLGVRTIAGRVTDRDGAFTDLTTTVTLVPPPRDRAYSVGADAGGPPTAQLFLNGSPILDVTAFDASFTGGVRVATGDVNGDGTPDLIAGTGPGVATLIRVFSGVDGSVLFEVAPFEEAFKGGVYVASGDLDGDGKDEIVVSPDEGGGPRVMIFRGGTFTKSADFFGIDDPDFRGGARVAFGDMNGDGKADLLVAAGFGGGPRVTAYDGTSVGGTLVTMFNLFVFEQSLRNGVFVTAGDLDGDGTADLVVGGGPGGGPRVLGLSGHDLTHGNLSDPKTLANFLAGDVDDRGGVRVTAKNLDADGLADLVVGDGAGSGGRVKTYLGATLAGGSTAPDLTLDATPGFTGGVFVG